MICEKEAKNKKPMVVRVLGPYGKCFRDEAEVLISVLTSKVAPVELCSEGETHADCVVAIDVKPKRLARLAAEEKSVILVPAQPRSRQGLNTYLRECRHFTKRDDWDKVTITRLNQSEAFFDRWWPLNVALFAGSVNYG